MAPADLRAFLRAQQWAIEATVTVLGVPQAAVIDVAITDSLELIFDTLTTPRKHTTSSTTHGLHLLLVRVTHVRRRLRAWQIAQMALTWSGFENYLAQFADGRERTKLPTIANWRVRPTWIRFSDFNADPPVIIEWKADHLANGNPDS
jgi:hypothetical protein